MSRLQLRVAFGCVGDPGIPDSDAGELARRFPNLIFCGIGAIANSGPIAILGSRRLSRLGLPINHAAIIAAWLYCGIIWIGCAYGLSHWGDVGRILGAQNHPYFEVLFAPWRMLIGYLIG